MASTFRDVSQNEKFSAINPPLKISIKSKAIKNDNEGGGHKIGKIGEWANVVYGFSYTVFP